GLRDVGNLVQIAGVQRLNFGDAGFAQACQRFFGQFVVGAGDDFTGAAVDDVFRQYAAQQIVFRHGDVLDAGSIDVAHVLAVDTLVFGNDDLAGFVGDIETRDFATQALVHGRHFAALFTQLEVVEDEEVF